MIEDGVYADLLIVYPKPYSISLRRTTCEPPQAKWPNIEVLGVPALSGGAWFRLLILSCDASEIEPLYAWFLMQCRSLCLFQAPLYVPQATSHWKLLNWHGC